MPTREDFEHQEMQKMKFIEVFHYQSDLGPVPIPLLVPSKATCCYAAVLLRHQGNKELPDLFPACLHRTKSLPNCRR